MPGSRLECSSTGCESHGSDMAGSRSQYALPAVEANAEYEPFQSVTRNKLEVGRGSEVITTDFDANVKYARDES